MNRAFESLNEEEMKQVFEKNKKLRDMVEDSYIENNMYHVSDILDTIRPALRDYSVGFYQRNRIDINTHKLLEVKSGIEKAMKAYEVFSAEEYEYFLEEVEKENISEVESILVDMFDNYTPDPTREEIYETYTDFYVPDRMESGYYVDEDFILYKDKTVSFK